MPRFAYRPVLAVMATSALLGACAQILGGDEYSVAPKRSGVGGDGGTALAAGASGGGGFAGAGAVVVDAQIPECRVASDCEPEACRIRRRCALHHVFCPCWKRLHHPRGRKALRCDWRLCGLPRRYRDERRRDGRRLRRAGLLAVSRSFGLRDKRGLRVESLRKLDLLPRDVQRRSKERR
jgi:hypothetical protein